MSAIYELVGSKATLQATRNCRNLVKNHCEWSPLVAYSTSFQPQLCHALTDMDNQRRRETPLGQRGAGQVSGVRNQPQRSSGLSGTVESGKRSSGSYFCTRPIRKKKQLPKSRCILNYDSPLAALYCVYSRLPLNRHPSRTVKMYWS